MKKYNRYSVEKKETMKMAGHYVRSLRTRKKLRWTDPEDNSSRDMTQKMVTDEVGLKHYTVVSQVETGTMRIPPHSTAAWAKALKVNRSDFAKALLSFYEPQRFLDAYGVRGLNDARFHQVVVEYFLDVSKMRKRTKREKK